MRSLASFLALLILSLAVPADARVPEAPPTSRALFEERVEFLSRDGGYWVAENQDHTGEDNSPTHFAYRFSAQLDGAILANEILGLFEDGRRVTYWRSVTWYDAETRSVRQRNWGLGDATTAGTLSVTPDGEELIELAGRGWDGSRIVFRDISTDEGPDRFSTRSVFLEDGEWVVRARYTWERTQEG